MYVTEMFLIFEKKYVIEMFFIIGKKMFIDMFLMFSRVINLLVAQCMPWKCTQISIQNFEHQSSIPSTGAKRYVEF